MSYYLHIQKDLFLKLFIGLWNRAPKNVRTKRNVFYTLQLFGNDFRPKISAYETTHGNRLIETKERVMGGINQIFSDL